MTRIIPNLSVDCVIFGFDLKKLNVMLTERELWDESNPSKLIFKDYTLQGHHVLENENLDDAAKRILKDKTGLDNIYLEQFYTFGNIDRLSKHKDLIWKESVGLNIPNQVISVGYYSLVDCEKVFPDELHQTSKWFPVDKLPELGFDHDKIIKKALEALRLKLSREPIGFELLPEKFTLTQLQKLYEAVLGKKLDRRNFRKKIANLKYLIPLDEKQSGVSHKPAQIFIFSKDVYIRTKTEKFDFSI